MTDEINRESKPRKKHQVPGHY